MSDANWDSKGDRHAVQAFPIERDAVALTEPCWLADKQWTLSVEKATLLVVPLSVRAHCKFSFWI
ncbi:hypothetical protein CA85_25400 [Allorhodopirellula solitaria]|uniref:Uncharacterized protein n=1 Tax=Allorhodopirellula solitaria TaxID=2527987 RepID=A0A5C5XX20_9BACT|nr:hypothetical protein CA85_25400 [Allorhodopirellula solitaria]